jgi:hypothetical protein
MDIWMGNWVGGCMDSHVGTDERTDHLASIQALRAEPCLSAFGVGQHSYGSVEYPTKENFKGAMLL